MSQATVFCVFSQRKHFPGMTDRKGKLYDLGIKLRYLFRNIYAVLVGVYLLGLADIVYKLNFVESFAFGSLISAVDPVATLAIFQGGYVVTCWNHVGNSRCQAPPPPSLFAHRLQKCFEDFS
jgi:hypothetical protein